LCFLPISWIFEERKSNNSKVPDTAPWPEQRETLPIIYRQGTKKWSSRWLRHWGSCRQGPAGSVFFCEETANVTRNGPSRAPNWGFIFLYYYGYFTLKGDNITTETF
jgi:hypothetical protein